MSIMFPHCGNEGYGTDQKNQGNDGYGEFENEDVHGNLPAWFVVTH
jgi:hypothetical protein